MVAQYKEMLRTGVRRTAMMTFKSLILVRMRAAQSQSQQTLQAPMPSEDDETGISFRDELRAHLLSAASALDYVALSPFWDAQSVNAGAPPAPPPLLTSDP